MYNNFDGHAVSIALVRARKNRIQLAVELGMAYSTVIGKLKNRTPASADFQARVAAVLGVKPSALRPKKCSKQRSRRTR